MDTFLTLLRRHSLVAGIGLMFLFTWPIDLSNSGLLPFKVPFLLYLFLGWGFIVAAVLMTGLTLGRHALAMLLKRYLHWRVGWKWYLVILIVPFLMALGVELNAIITQTPADFSHVIADQLRPGSVSRLAFVIPFFLTDLIANGEEIGWRGYVLPRLQGKYGSLASALLVGVIWGLWHTPKFITHWDTSSFAIFMVDTIAKSVLLAWVYNGTRGSLLLTMLCHSAWNTAGIFLPVSNTLSNANNGASLVVVVLVVISVAAIVVVSRASQFSPHEPIQVQA